MVYSLMDSFKDMNNQGLKYLLQIVQIMRRLTHFNDQPAHVMCDNLIDDIKKDIKTHNNCDCMPHGNF